MISCYNTPAGKPGLMQEIIKAVNASSKEKASMDQLRKDYEAYLEARKPPNQLEFTVDFS